MLRPSPSTSGGHSIVVLPLETCELGVAAPGVVGGLVTPFTKLENADLEEQARQL